MKVTDQPSPHVVLPLPLRGGRMIAAVVVEQRDRLYRPAGYKPVEHTCPLIDRVIAIVKRLDGGCVEGCDALDMLEQLRAQNAQLRANAAAWETACKDERRTRPPANSGDDRPA